MNTFLTITQQELVQCLDIRDYILKTIYEEDVINFIIQYALFEKKKTEEIRTKLKEAEETYKKNSKRFETMTQKANAVFFMIDPFTMKFTFSKGKGLEALWLKDDEVVGRHVMEYYGDNSAILNGIDLAAQGKERQGVLKTGTRYFDVNFTPIFDEDNHVIEIVGMAYDNSKHVKTEEKFQTLNKEKDKFFSIIAHDLKGPFNAILGVLDILEEQFKNLSPDEIEEDIGIVNSSAHKAYNLLESLLERARAQSSSRFSPEYFSLYEESTNQISLLQGSALSKNITIINDISQDITLFADKKMIAAVLRNLVSNAIKFTWGKNNLGHILLSSQTQGNYIKISIVDNGVGMEEKQIQQLFKLDTVHSMQWTLKEIWSGLGLLLCKELIEKHWWTIRVERSKPGEWTVISFLLPNIYKQ